MRTFLQKTSILKTRSQKILFLLFTLSFILPTSQWAQVQTFTFTPCGATGQAGPTQLQVTTAYASTNLNGSVVATGTAGIQTFTIPIAGQYRIESIGAQGGSAGATLGGLGARMIGDFTFTVGTVLKIVVGQQGLGSSTGAAGGGGGSYVATIGNVPLVVAGGGSGAANTGYPGTSAGTGSVGNPGGTCANAGVTGFGGGDASSCGSGAGGAGGFYGDGLSGGSWGSQRGFGFVNGSGGGTSGSGARHGGFGGGAGTHQNNTGGGAGGGYTGGGASYHGGTYVGGAGSSYNAGTNQTNTAAYNSGEGKVLLTRLCNISLVSSSNPICNGAAVTLTTDAISNYTWSTGSNAASIVVSPSVTTSYTLTATSPSNCVTSAVITISVDPALPTLTVVNTASVGSGVCPGVPVTLTASGATTYSWTGGVVNGAAFTPTTASGYTVTGTNACGSTTAATSVSVHPTPTITATASTPSLCSGNTATLIGGGGVGTYTWTGGSGNITNGQAFFPNATAMYTVVGASVLGCTAQAVVGITVAQTPVLAPVATPTLICLGSSGTVAATGASNYTWVPVNNFAGSNNGTIVITPTTTTTYTLIKSNVNCFDTKTITVYVNALPNVFAIAQPTIVCAGTQATLSGGGANTYTWVPSSFNLIGANVAVTPTANTIYTVTGSDGTCTATYTLLLPTKTTPTITAVTTSSAICAGGTVTLTATGAGNGGTYTWTPGPLNGSVIVVSPASPISYQVNGTNTLNCEAQTSQVVIVYQNPPVTAAPNRSLVCVGGPSTITATGANTYTWSTGALTPTTLVNPLVTTVYTVTGTFTNTGCSTTKTVMVQAFTPVSAILGPTAVCIGSSITISSAPANNYTWSIGSTIIGNNISVVVNPTVNTTYSLTTITTSNNVSCVGANTVDIQVNPLPIITTSCTRTLICKIYESTILNAAGGVSYNWLFLGTGSSISVSPQLQTTYTVEGTDANGCVNTATIMIRVSACLGVNEASQETQGISIFPNPSSGEFSIQAKESMDLNLINELGQVVRSVNLTAENNYQSTVKDVANGVYFIVAKDKQHQINQKVVIQK